VPLLRKRPGRFGKTGAPWGWAGRRNSPDTAPDLSTKHIDVLCGRVLRGPQKQLDMWSVLFRFTITGDDYGSRLRHTMPESGHPIVHPNRRRNRPPILFRTSSDPGICFLFVDTSLDVLLIGWSATKMSRKNGTPLLYVQGYFRPNSLIAFSLAIFWKTPSLILPSARHSRSSSRDRKGMLKPQRSVPKRRRS